LGTDPRSRLSEKDVVMRYIAVKDTNIVTDETLVA
jgi:hypothetical protein